MVRVQNHVQRKKLLIQCQDIQEIDENIYENKENNFANKIMNYR